MPETDSLDIDKLVAGIKSGDRQSFALLYDLYSGAIYGVIFRLINDDDVAKAKAVHKHRQGEGAHAAVASSAAML